MNTKYYYDYQNERKYHHINEMKEMKERKLKKIMK